MKPKFFCDENITREIQNLIKKQGYEITSVRDKKLFGMENGNLTNYLNENKFTLITFDKDFLNKNVKIDEGAIIIDVHPNRNEFTRPIIEEFLKYLKNESVKLSGTRIRLNKQYLEEHK